MKKESKQDLVLDNMWEVGAESKFLHVAGRCILAQFA